MNTKEPTNDKNEWVILEAMGHTRIAGRYFNENGLHRVDVPDTSKEADPNRFIRTERYGSGAIFRITTVTEEAARLVAKQCVIPEAIPWDVRHELKQLAAPAEVVEGERGYKADFVDNDSDWVAEDERNTFGPYKDENIGFEGEEI